MKALILIGGEGTRLRPLTYTTLKCMVPIANRHFIDYQMKLLKKNSIREVILSICYLPEKVKKAVGSGKKYGMKIRYAREKEPLGTAGAIKNCEKYLDDTTVIMNGDILTDIDINGMLKSHKDKKAVVTIALHKVDNPSAYGLVLTQKSGRVISFIEKPGEAEAPTNWINAGIYIFDRKALGFIPAGIKCSVEREIFPALIEKGEPVFGYKTGAYWLDIGKIDSYRKANYDVLSGKFRNPFGATAGRKIIIGKNTKIDRKANITGPFIIGAGSAVCKGAAIKNSIIWDRVKIGQGAVIKDSIIGEKCVVKPGAEVADAVIGGGTVVSSGTIGAEK